MDRVYIAIVAHEANRSFCRALHDFSQESWEQAPEWQRISAIHGVEFHLANPDAGPEASHEAWRAEKVADGWVYGPVKNAEEKTHPCLVDFDELPLEQQLKDVLFRNIVHALAPMVTGAPAGLTAQDIAGITAANMTDTDPPPMPKDPSDGPVPVVLR